jgi:hypothetical protein
MKKYILLLCLICLIPLIAYAKGVYYYEAGQPSAPAGFCAGGELFCSEFNTDGEITWTTTTWGATEDCDGYDANGDWCDYDAIAPQPLVDGHGLGVRGANTVYGQKSFGSGVKEFYVEWTWQANTIGNVFSINITDVTNSTHVISAYTALSELKFYYDGVAKNVGTGDTLSADTTYHLGVYYKQSATDSSADGVIMVYMNTDGTAFDFADRIYSKTNLDIDTLNNAEAVRFRGPSTGNVGHYDNVKVVACSSNPWPES